MVSGNYSRALVLSTLLGCSAPPETRNSGYIESPPASAEENRLMDHYVHRLISIEQLPVNPFHGKRVSLLYPTQDGPISGSDGYTGGRPLNPSLLDSARSELRERKAYVLEEGVFGARYSNKIATSRMPNMNPADLVVIADEAPNLSGDLKNVYFVEKNGNEYKLVEAKR